MKERPILFTGPSIPMVMDGTKTQTRRIADMDHLSVDLPKDVRSDLWDEMPASERRVAKKGRHRVGMNAQGAVSVILAEGQVFGLRPGEFHFRCPLVDGTTHLADHGNGKKIWTVTPEGEQRLWVRETWGLHAYGDEGDWFRGSVSGVPWESIQVQFKLALRADWGPMQEGCFWRPGIFMPRWASRTNLIPLQARLMRLQDITDEDAVAEGVRFTDYGTGRAGWRYGGSKTSEECLYSPRAAFGNVWNQIHGGERWNLKPDPCPWDQNPWVWAYTFRKEIA